MAFQPYQAMWRLAGIDHLHVHGMGGKFAQRDEDVADAARACLAPLAGASDLDDRIVPAFSSGQWAGTLPRTLEVVPDGDLLFLCGGGILAHPGGPAAGVKSVRQAWEATRAGRTLADAARDAPELRDALAFFGS
jgi:ribulose-bisphosphate carboxylase large chain